MKERLNKLSYFSLFVHTFSISAFALGGGYVMIPMLRERFVKKLGWLDEEEMITLTAIGQSGPGAIIVNATTLMGYRILGVGGAICCALGTALPALIAIVIAAYFYELIRDNAYVSAAFRGMRAGVAAIIADTVFTMAAPYFKRDQALFGGLMVLAFLVSFFFNVNVGFIIVGCALIGVAAGRFKRKGGAGK